MAFAVYRKSKNKDLRGILISPFFYSLKEAEEFAKNKNFTCIEILNLFAHGKDNFMNAKRFADSVIEEYIKDKPSINQNEIQELKYKLEDMTLIKAKALSELFKKNNFFYKYQSSTKYNDFMEKLELMKNTQFEKELEEGGR